MANVPVVAVLRVWILLNPLRKILEGHGIQINLEARSCINISF